MDEMNWIALIRFTSMYPSLRLTSAVILSPHHQFLRIAVLVNVVGDHIQIQHLRLQRAENKQRQKVIRAGVRLAQHREQHLRRLRQAGQHVLRRPAARDRLQLLHRRREQRVGDVLYA